MEVSVIFTDGASKGNPGPGGFGAVILQNGQVKEIGGYERNTTNNRMEITAAIKALQNVPEGTENIVYSDSAYLINGITKWIFGWSKNGWKTAMKTDVENKDLWESLFSLTQGRKIKWIKVAGHADTPGNSRADEIASSFAEEKPPELFSGRKDEYSADLSKIGNLKASRSQKAHSYVSHVEGKILVHKTWEECKERVLGKSGALYKKSMSAEDEKNIIEKFSKQ